MENVELDEKQLLKDGMEIVLKEILKSIHLGIDQGLISVADNPFDVIKGVTESARKVLIEGFKEARLSDKKAFDKRSAESILKYMKLK